MNWIKLESTPQLEEINRKSEQQPILILKHSTRCPVSFAALERIEEGSKALEGIGFQAYFLDLINYRSISNKITELYKVTHQSPQILIIKKGKAIYHNSHMGVSIQNIKKALQ